MLGAKRTFGVVGGWAVAVGALVGCDIITGVGDYEVAEGRQPGPADAVPNDAVPSGSDRDGDSVAAGDGTPGSGQAPTGGDDTAAPGAGTNGDPVAPSPPPSEAPPNDIAPPGADGPAPAGPAPAAPAPAAPAPSEELCPDQLSSFDDVYATIADDLVLLDPAEAVTTRYLSLANRFTAGVCADTSLDTDRQALFKLVNALSTGTTIEQPVAVDPDRTLYRIDLADYGWDQAVTVVNADGSTSNFLDKWEAIVANNPYAVPFVGDDADDAVQASGSAVPVMTADSVLDVASIGNLYYALVGVDVQATLDDFILNDLQIDTVQNLLDEEQVRAGTTVSRVSRQDRMVQRDEIEIRQGVLWQSFDFADDGSIFEDPFGFAEGGAEAIFSLPNGMFGFIIADENSAIVEDSDILLDTNQNNFRAITSVSCSNCHAQGLLPVVDEVRDIALANARASGLNLDEVEQLETVFPEPTELAAVFEDDNDNFHRSALTLAGVPLTGGDPLSSVFFRFDTDLLLADAAGDLGVTPEQLADEITQLDPLIQVLANGGTLDRDDFSNAYVNALCFVSLVNENQPDPAVCDAAAAAALVP